MREIEAPAQAEEASRVPGGSAPDMLDPPAAAPATPQAPAAPLGAGVDFETSFAPARLSRTELDGLANAIIDAGLAGQRAKLLEGMKPVFTSGLQPSSTPNAQLRLDLAAMNGLRTSDGSAPMARWLINAVELAAGTPAADAFRRAFARISGPAAPELPAGAASTQVKLSLDELRAVGAAALRASLEISVTRCCSG